MFNIPSANILTHVTLQAWCLPQLASTIMLYIIEINYTAASSVEIGACDMKPGCDAGARDMKPGLSDGAQYTGHSGTTSLTISRIFME